MSSVKEFFAELYGNTGQAVFVLDREQNFIYTAPEAEAFLAAMSEEEITVIKREADYCLKGQKSTELFMDQMGLNLLPYPYEGDWYLLVKAEKKNTPLTDEQTLGIFRNSYEKLIGYLNEVYGEAQRIGLTTESGKNLASGVRRILRMINHMDLILDGNRRAEYRVPMDLSDFTATFVQSYMDTAPGTEIGLWIKDTGLYAGVMPENLELVLATLVSNAMRFGEGQVSVAASRAGEKVRITVCDNGPGVQDPERLFEAGYRTVDQKGVYGLGYSLFMAKKLAEQQGAALLYERRGNETCFHFEADAIDLPEGRLASWKPEDLDNSLSQLRIEISDFVKEMDL